MADPITEPKNRIERINAKAAEFWRAWIGLLVFLRDHAKAFIEWAADEKPGAVRKPWLTAARWEEIKEVAVGVPMLIAQLCICAGLIVNLCRSQVSAIETADPLDGAALVSADLPQVQGWFWLMALWLVCATIKAVVKSITVNIVSKA